MGHCRNHPLWRLTGASVFAQHAEAESDYFAFRLTL